MTAEKLIPLPEAAARLGVSYRVAKAMVDGGQIPRDAVVYSGKIRPRAYLRESFLSPVESAPALSYTYSVHPVSA